MFMLAAGKRIMRIPGGYGAALCALAVSLAGLALSTIRF